MEAIARSPQDFELLKDKYDAPSLDKLALESAFTRISPDEAAAITLCYSYGFSHREVSDILSMPLGTVKTHILRGKSKLRELL